MEDDIELIEFHDARFRGLSLRAGGGAELEMGGLLVWRREDAERVRLHNCDATLSASGIRSLSTRGPIDAASRVSDGVVTLRSGEKLEELTSLARVEQNGVCVLVLDNATEIAIDARSLNLRLGVCEPTDEIWETSALRP